MSDTHPEDNQSNFVPTPIEGKTGQIKTLGLKVTWKFDAPGGSQYQSIQVESFTSSAIRPGATNEEISEFRHQVQDAMLDEIYTTFEKGKSSGGRNLKVKKTFLGLPLIDCDVPGTEVAEPMSIIHSIEVQPEPITMEIRPEPKKAPTPELTPSVELTGIPEPEFIDISVAKTLRTTSGKLFAELTIPYLENMRNKLNSILDGADPMPEGWSRKDVILRRNAAYTLIHTS